MAEPAPPSNSNKPAEKVKSWFSASGYNPLVAFLRRIVIPVAAISALCLLVYYPLHAAGFIWDDGYWILNDPAMHHWWDLRFVWFDPMTFMQYYPLSVTAYFLQWQLWGSDALGFHTVSFLLQVINAVFLWRILRRLRLRAAWLAAAIFAIHPVVVESVAWVVEQKNLISGFLVLAAVWSWIRFAGLDGPDEQLESGAPVYQWRFFAAALTCYFLAVCAKTFVCALPAAILILTWWKLGRITRKHLVAGVPWFVITAGAGWMAAWRERNGAGAHGNAYHFTLFQHLVIAGKDIWFYVGKLFWPHPILMVYPRWQVHGFTTIDLLYPLTAALVAVGSFALRKRFGRGLFAATAIYAVMVSPALGFVPFAGMTITFVADHYFYLGCISLIVLAVQIGAMAVSKLPVNSRSRYTQNPTRTSSAPIGAIHFRLSTAVAAGVLAALGLVSYVQCTYYVPPLKIWVHELDYDKQCFKAYEIMAIHELIHHHLNQEFADCQAALKITKGTDPVANELLGSLYLENKHNIPLAMQYFRKSLMADPYQAKIIIKLAHCYQQQGNWKMAVKDLNRGIALMPGSSALYLAFAQAQSHQGNTTLAIKALRDAIACDSHNADARYNLGVILDGSGHWRQAMAEYRKALAINPGLVPAHYFYGLDLLNHAHPAAAVQQFRTVLTLNPGNPSALALLAKALRAAGHPRPAAATGQHASQTQK